jgi:transcriptional regulator with XRE-family HTH domain
MPSLRLQFGRNLRNLRISRNWTQEHLAERLGVSVNFVSFVERGIKSPSFDRLEQIARTFRVPVAQLFEVGGKNSDRQRVDRRVRGPSPA